MIEVTEKQLEDWVCVNLGRVVGHEDTALVGRQMQLVSGGVLDVLAARYGIPDWGDTPVWTITIIELKRDTVDDHAVAQLLGYMGALDEMIGFARDYEVYPCIEGIVAAPKITTSAEYALRGATRIRYACLRPTVEVSHWDPWRVDIHPPPHVNANKATRRVVEQIAQAVPRRDIEGLVKVLARRERNGLQQG